MSELVERLWPFIKATAEDMAWQMLPGEAALLRPAIHH